MWRQRMDSLYGERGLYPCVRWLNNQCTLTAEMCKFPHSKEHMPLCRKWKDGHCIGGHGNTCGYRHYYNEGDQSELRTNQQQVESRSQQPITFSSPLVERVHVVEERQRRVEVDLETGRRNSFFEVTTKEIVDLTGSMNDMEPAVEAANESRVALGEISTNTMTNSNTASFESGICYICGNKFKGVKGVRAHLNRKKGTCAEKHRKRAKENISSGGSKSSQLEETDNNDSIMIIDHPS